MTTTRLAEIAERHELLAKLLFATDWPPTEKQTTDEMWVNHNRRGPDDAARRYLKLAAVAQGFILTAAQARSREDAEIMREVVAGAYTRYTKFTTCNYCGASAPHMTINVVVPHKPDCLVTKLRTRADQLGGRADG